MTASTWILDTDHVTGELFRPSAVLDYLGVKVGLQLNQWRQGGMVVLHCSGALNEVREMLPNILKLSAVFIAALAGMLAFELYFNVEIREWMRWLIVLVPVALTLWLTGPRPLEKSK